ncbi:MAG TPA: methyltransferase regulatory domain-containing protein [Polyangiaceae bacterium]|nr:methyltransferase regulatory domain-containing protein [Polyangiaceae bacterium]
MPEPEDAPPTLYDVVEYPAKPYTATHPDRLCTLGRLHGLPAADPRSCRLLEIGCSDGGNLLAMAVGLPGSRFVGVDYAPTSIQAAQAAARATGLANVEFLSGDLRRLGPELGQFDYLVAHGVYSWVPPDVQNALLALARRVLAPSGIAFVSYNALPGGYLRKIARDLVRFHVRGETDPERMIESALNFLSETTARVPADDPYRAALERELTRLVRAGTSFVFHDVLSPENESLYFEAFAERAAALGLSYLTEAHFFESHSGAELAGGRALAPETANRDVVRAEQYLDFARGRAFRQTLLVRDDARFDRTFAPSRVEELRAVARVEIVPREDDAAGSQLERFRAGAGAIVTTDDPIAKIALAELGNAWPKTLSFDELVAAERNRCAPDVKDGELRTALARVLLQLFGGNVLELRMTEPANAKTVGEKPRASALARHQARESDQVTNLRHARVSVEDPGLRSLLLLLDGTRTREELLAALTELEGGADWTAARIEAFLGEICARGLLV